MAFDIGGVLSKYPEQFLQLFESLWTHHKLYVITDMHDREKTLQMLRDNGFLRYLPEQMVVNSDYEKYGEMCKAVLLRDLKIDIFFDDFAGYMTWDSQLGPAPIRLMVQPDPFKPYWAESWKTDPADGDFGRRKSPSLWKRLDIDQIKQQAAQDFWDELEKESNEQGKAEAKEEAGS